MWLQFALNFKVDLMYLMLCPVTITGKLLIKKKK